jgi:hypothetical protein
MSFVPEEVMSELRWLIKLPEKFEKAAEIVNFLMITSSCKILQYEWITGHDNFGLIPILYLGVNLTG